MSLGQLLDSFQTCVSYCPRHYCDPLATPPPSPLPPGNAVKILANIDSYFACVTSVQPTQFNIVWWGGGKRGITAKFAAIAFTVPALLARIVAYVRSFFFCYCRG